MRLLKNVISEGRYALNDILKKIDTIWIQGDLTDDEKTNLVNMAREHALPENSFAPWQEQIDILAAQVNGKKYECIAPEGVAVVWDPVTYPAYWQLVE